MTNDRTAVSKDYPALPVAWVDDCIVELRMRDVAGSRIAEILTEADEHCRAAGQSAYDALGDPRRYAADFDFPGQERSPGAGLQRYVLWGALTLLGSMIVIRAAGPIATGQAMDVTVGDVASIVLIMAVLLTVGRWLRAFATNPLVVGGVGMVVVMGLFVALRLFAGPVLFTLPAFAAVGVGSAVMLFGAIGLTVQTLRDPQDLLSTPGRAPERNRRDDLIQLVGIWMLPVFTGVMVLVSLMG